MPVLESDRLTLRRITPDDAEFMLALLNEPSFHQYIGDRGVRTLEDAARYIANGPMASYEKFGFGLWLVVSKATGEAMGICGLLKRETLDHPDIGFAFRPAFWGQGYALESASAVLAHGREAHGMGRIDAIVQPDNARSIRLLEKLAFRHESRVRLTPEGEELLLMASETSG
jgi:RimJ/RimL family protein N-acetyltransferase